MPTTDQRITGARDSPGWRRTWRRLSTRLPHVLTLSVFVRPADAEGRGAVERRGFALVEFSAADLDCLLGFRRPDQIEPLRRHLQRGGRGWYARRDGQVAAYACLALVAGPRPERHRYVLLHPGEASAILMFTREEFRGLGLGRALLDDLTAIAYSEHGVRSMAGWTASSNAASCRMHRAAGYQPAGFVHVLLAWYRPVFTLARGTPVPR